MNRLYLLYIAWFKPSSYYCFYKANGLGRAMEKDILRNDNHLLKMLSVTFWTHLMPQRTGMVSALLKEKDIGQVYLFIISKYYFTSSNTRKS